MANKSVTGMVIINVKGSESTDEHSHYDFVLST